MFATVFCNFIGTILSTVAVNLQLHIEYSIKNNGEDGNNIPVPNFIEYPPVMGDYIFHPDSENHFQVVVDLGTVQLGQSRDIIMNVPFDNRSGKYFDFTYFYTYKIGGKSIRINGSSSSSSTDADKLINIHIARYTTVELLRKIINYKNIGEHSTAAELLISLQEYYSSRQHLCDTLSTGIKTNIADQVKIAIINDQYFKRWGEFYIDQLSRSLNQQIKPNFKDTACMFGGEVFEYLVDKASDIFDALPPPEPSLIDQSLSYGSISPNYRSAGIGVQPYCPQSSGISCWL